VAENPQKVMNS